MAAALAHRPARDVPSGAVAPAPAAPHGDGPLADVIPLRPRRAAVPAHVYRRRRIVAALLLLGVLGLAAVGMRSLVAAPAAPVAPAASAEPVLLEPGDTLWELAVAATPPGADPRVTLAEIRELNGFGGDVVPAWTTVLVPTS